MAKRFTDTDKWRKPWFRALEPNARTVWTYLTDCCDHAGVWPAAFDLMSSDVGFEVIREDLHVWFGDKLVHFGDKVFIPSFIEFQYGELHEDSRPHMSVIKQLKKYAIDPQTLTLSIQYPKGMDTLKEKEKDQDKEKGGISEKEIFQSLPLFTRDQLEKKYPPATLAEGLTECVMFYSTDPSAPAWPALKWGKLLISWMLEKKRRDLNRGPKLVAPVTGGWDD